MLHVNISDIDLRCIAFMITAFFINDKSIRDNVIFPVHSNITFPEIFYIYGAEICLKSTRRPTKLKPSLIFSFL